MSLARLFGIIGLACLPVSFGLTGCRSAEKEQEIVDDRPGGTGSRSIAPTVTSLIPGHNEMVTVDDSLVATFSEPVVATSVTSGFRVTLGGESIEGSIALSSDGRTATFKPAASLIAGGTYTITLQDIKDADGNKIVKKTTNFQAAE